MALRECPECQKMVSSAAAACPHCGYPLKNAEPPPVPTSGSNHATSQAAEPTLNLKTGSHGYCPTCNHPYIVKGDMSGSESYVCEKCGRTTPVNELATAFNWGCLIILGIALLALLGVIGSCAS